MPSEHDPVIVDTIENGEKVRIYKSKEHNEYPNVDVLTLLFGMPQLYSLRALANNWQNIRPSQTTMPLSTSKPPTPQTC